MGESEGKEGETEGKQGLHTVSKNFFCLLLSVLCHLFSVFCPLLLAAISVPNSCFGFWPFSSVAFKSNILLFLVILTILVRGAVKVTT